MTTYTCLLWQVLSHSKVVDIYAESKFRQKDNGLGYCSTCGQTRLLCHPYMCYWWCLDCYKYKLKNGLGRYVSIQNQIYIITNVHGSSTAQCKGCCNQSTSFIYASPNVFGFIC